MRRRVFRAEHLFSSIFRRRDEGRDAYLLNAKSAASQASVPAMSRLEMFIRTTETGVFFACRDVCGSKASGIRFPRKENKSESWKSAVARVTREERFLAFFPHASVPPEHGDGGRAAGLLDKSISAV